MTGATDSLGVLERYRSEIDDAEITRRRADRRRSMQRPHWSRFHEILAALPDRAALRKRGFAVPVKLDRSIAIGRAEELLEFERGLLEEAVQLLVPWRKGPFRLFGYDIDAEWRSDMKWERVVPLLEGAKGKRIADVGCGNGYYLFRAAELEPECVVGLDPSESFELAFSLLQRFAAIDALHFEGLGIEDLPLFPKFFDVILCMGVIYHQRDPLGALRLLAGALRPGGELVLESQAIVGQESQALFPEARYAKARNVYFVPTANCLAAWLRRSGFIDVAVRSFVPVTHEEQRRTALAPYESLSDFLDPDDPSRTVEGYPAPQRAIVTGRLPL
ncbi:MAG: tRNA 5-methoxyuridine(34)/uridine 5-oxyacetic acid(34) synthase CmoB [Bdellovibrionales bacterium]|nr:tRNA 5-methoxyuridine(34)/uridine 5-oxyacetic acid(34) synthase CmoB [Bdellovibrionales bacterium]